MKNSPLFIFLIALSFFSCRDRETVLAKIDAIVVEGYLYANQPVTNFKVSNTISVASENKEQTPIPDAQVTITSNGNSFVLQPSSVEGIYENKDLIPESGKTYELEVIFEGDTVTAITAVPYPPQNLKSSETEIAIEKVEDRANVNFSDLPEPIEISWEDGNSNYYLVSITNIEEDPELVNELFGTQGLPVISQEPEITTSFIIDSFQFFTHYGRYEVAVYRVNLEYVTLYESVDTGQGALTEIKTNVEGGLGIFTGVGSAKIEMNVTKI